MSTAQTSMMNKDQRFMSVRCVVFDIDDSLYLEREYVRSGFNAVGTWARTHLGLDDFSIRAWKLFVSGLRGNIFNQVLASYEREATPAILKQFITIYRTHPPSIQLLPDAKRCLEDLHGRVGLAAITSGPRESQRAKIYALGLAQWLSPILSTAELGSNVEKPHPHAFKLLESITGYSAGACLYVADNPTKDFSAPANLGWRTVRIRRVGGLHELEPGGTDIDHTIQNLHKLTELVLLY